MLELSDNDFKVVIINYFNNRMWIILSKKMKKNFKNLKKNQMVSEGRSGGIERFCIHLLHGYTNLKLFINEFLLKKNCRLTKQIMHNKKHRERKERTW